MTKKQCIDLLTFFFFYKRERYFVFIPITLLNELRLTQVNICYFICLNASLNVDFDPWNASFVRTLTVTDFFLALFWHQQQ